MATLIEVQNSLLDAIDVRADAATTTAEEIAYLAQALREVGPGTTLAQFNLIATAVQAEVEGLHGQVSAWVIKVEQDKNAAQVARVGAEAAISAIQNIQDTAQASADAAAGSANVASTKAGEANASANAAAGSASAAAGSASTASTKADEAIAARNIATTKSDEAGASASSAAGSATAADNSADAAARSATESADAAVVATTKAAEATASASSADASEAAALASANAADASEDAAAASAATALGAANTATAKAADAGEAATLATNKAAEATVGANDADTSATASANSASAAATSADESEEAALMAAEKSEEAAASAAAANTSKDDADRSANAAGASADAAAASAGSAETDAATATTKAGEALVSANTATAKADEASGAATVATTKASEAATSAANLDAAAQTAATKASEANASKVAAETAAQTATTKASEASTSASNAGSSEANALASAQSSASNATASADSAAFSNQRAVDAETAKNTAQSAREDAVEARAGALSSETNAANSAGSASGSAAAALASQQASAQSESSAAASADTATTKASEAVASAGNAAQSAADAGTSADSAAASADTATQRATDAAVSAADALSHKGAAETAKNQMQVLYGDFSAIRDAVEAAEGHTATSAQSASAAAASADEAALASSTAVDAADSAEYWAGIAAGVANGDASGIRFTPTDNIGAGNVQAAISELDDELRTLIADRAASDHDHTNATALDHGFMSKDDKAKLDAVQPGATANQTDAHLLDRQNHTGLQNIDTIEGLRAALDAAGSAEHTHPIGEVDGLAAAIDGIHDQLDAVTGSATTLRSDLTELETTVEGKADEAHRHAIEDVDGLQAALDNLSTVTDFSDLGNTPTTVAGYGITDLDARVRSTTLNGIITTDASPLTETDTVLVGIGKVQGQVSGMYQSLNNTKAPKNSPELTGTPTAPTPAAGDKSTKLATTAFVDTAIDSHVVSYPDLNAGGASTDTTIPDAISNLYYRLFFADNKINNRAPLASPALTGNPTAPTQTAGDKSTKLATTAFVDQAIQAIVGMAPTDLDTLHEIAARIQAGEGMNEALITQLAGKLTASMNLSDLTDAAAARANLGLGLEYLANLIASGAEQQFPLFADKFPMVRNADGTMQYITWQNIQNRMAQSTVLQGHFNSLFAAKSHRHTAEDIDGLEEAVGGKADLVGGKVPLSQLPESVITSPVITGVTGTTLTIPGGYGKLILLTRNGVKVPSNEYTATNGTTVTLTHAAAATDEFEAVSLNAFNVANLATVASTGRYADLVGAPQINVSTSEPAASQGNNGDVWFIVEEEG